MNVVGLDIGGANLKAADVAGRAVTETFEIWRDPEQLTERIAALLEGFPPADVVAVTMTAELADCFETKAEGVDFILDAVRRAAQSSRVLVWQTDGCFLSLPDKEPVRAGPESTLICQKIAAANWHALATWAGRLAPEGAALLVDIGSTTTDIIPLQDGAPCPRGLTDPERLMSGELVYSGVRRTPLCAMALAVPFRGGYCPIAAELFATMLDVYLTLGSIPEHAADRHTANGRPATKAAAHDRLARQFCCDRTEFTADDALAAARFLAAVHQQRLRGALDRVLAEFTRTCAAVVISGSGFFLARELLTNHPRTSGARLVSLADELSPAVAEAACAYAVAVLGTEVGSNRFRAGRVSDGPLE